MTQQLIDREVVKQLVVALESNWAPRSTNYSEDFNARKSALAAGRAALANAEPTGWIAVKDRMPPPQVRVLGFAPRYNIVVVDMWLGPDFNWGYSYWMPLPTPPKDTP